MNSRTLVAIAMLTAACTPSSEPPANAPPSAAAPPPGTAAEATAEDTCGADRYRDLIGSNVDETTLRDNTDARIIAPDSAVTQDFRPDRLNVILDADGRITSLECY